MNRRSVSARVVLGMLLTLLTVVGVTGCRAPLYYYTQNQFAGRAVPPSGLQQRVLATYTSTGTTGGAEILDGLRDLRNNVQNTIPTFSIAGYSGGYPEQILNFPEQQVGYILDRTNGNVGSVNYATERSVSSSVVQLGAYAPSFAVSPDGSRAVGATATNGQILVYGTGLQAGAAGPYYLNLPNVNRVIMNPGNSAILAMTRNSNSLYRIIQLPQTNNPQPIPGAVDCQPLLLPVYCVVPVPGNYDRPTNAYFSLDGSTVYIENCGPECGGSQASITALNVSALTYNVIPTVDPLSSGAPSPLASLSVPNPIPIPGGVTAAVSDGTNLYLSGQSLLRPTSTGALGTTPAADGLLTGYMTVVPLNTLVASNPVSISDGTHTRMLLADNNTLWIGSNNCAAGERARIGANINCLTMVNLASSSPTATVIPANVVPGGSTTVGYPNTNGNLYYYGDLTGLCWVQGYNKVYTAYGGQVHAFYTGGPITSSYDPAHGTTPAAGTELNNYYFTVQGTVLDVAYMDALTNQAN